jgi:hypothetical protein
MAEGKRVRKSQALVVHVYLLGGQRAGGSQFEVSLRK